MTGNIKQEETKVDIRKEVYAPSGLPFDQFFDNV
jgi:hypothetical protein